MTNFLFFLLGLIVGGLMGIVMMCLCIIAKKSDEHMIVAPIELEGKNGVYAVVPNSKRLGGFIPENAYVFADANEKHSRNPFLVDGMVPDDNGTETAAVSQSVACG